MLAKKLDPRATLPTCAHPDSDLGYDLYALEDVELHRGIVTRVRTGVAVEHRHATLEPVHSQTTMCHYVHCRSGLLIRDRSSVASSGIVVSGGVIDGGYRGEVIVLMTASKYPCHVEAGNKIAQMIPIPVLTGEGVMEIEAFTEEITSRGANGFGSTGR